MFTVSYVSSFRNEKEILFANIYIPSDSKWKGYGNYINAMLYFERITEQNSHQRLYYNHGVITDKTTNYWINEIQSKYLIPMINNQLNINEKNELIEIPKYMNELMKYFCNSKEIINVSCIENEVKYMHKKLKLILFENIKTVNNIVEINNINLKKIFPKLKQYKHYAGYWVNMDSVLQIKIVEKETKEINEYDFIEGALKVVKSLKLTNNTSEHYFDYYIKKEKQWNKIIKINNYKQIIQNTPIEDIDMFINNFENASKNVNNLNNEQNKFIKMSNKISLTENVTHHNQCLKL